MSYIAGVELTTVATNAEGPEFALGTVYRASSGKQYKYVQFNNGAGGVACVAADCCYYYAVSGASAGQVDIVTSDTTDNGGVGAGVFQAVIADTGYGWIQTKGVAVVNGITASADGNALTAVGGADGEFDVSTAVTDFICAVSVDDTANIIMLTCPD